MCDSELQEFFCTNNTSDNDNYLSGCSYRFQILIIGKVSEEEQKEIDRINSEQPTYTFK